MKEETTKAVVVGGNVQGDITSCKIEQQVKFIQQGHIFSLSKRTTYMVYDVCNKQVLSEYTLPALSEAGAVLVFILIVVMGTAGLEGLKRVPRW